MPVDESARLDALRQSGILNTPVEEEFEDVVQLAATLCDTPLSAIGFLDERGEWIKAQVGSQPAKTDRVSTFCAHAILNPALPLIISDATQDPRFADHPMVTGCPSIRFYAGVPIVTQDGHAIGVLCVMDTVSRTLRPDQIDGLVRLKRQTMRLIEARQRRKSYPDQRELIPRAATVEADQWRSRFLASFSHELRTPLNPILGLSATLMEQVLPAEQKDAAGLILQCGESLLETIQTILTNGRLEAGMLKLDAQPFDLAATILVALRKTADAAYKKELEFDHSIDPQTPADLVGDAFRLQQVLVHLLANAITFTERGRIYLRVRGRRLPSGECELRVAVADSGIGLVPEEVSRLIEPCTHANDSNPCRFQSTGLEWSNCHSLVQLMGGNLEVLSKPGVGSIARFSVRLPFVTDHAVYHAVPPPELAGKRLLLIEDDPVRRRHLLAVTASWGLRISAVDTEREGRELIQSQPFDCLIRRATVEGTSVRWSSGGQLIPVAWILPQGHSRTEKEEGRSTLLFSPFGATDLRQALLALIGAEPTSRLKQAAKVISGRKGDRLPLRILGADANATDRHVLKFIFRHLGYQADLAETGADVLRALDTPSYDLLLLDVQMPVLDGLAVAREICRRFPEVERRPKLVAVTASAEPGDRAECFEAGMDAFLCKPLSPQNVRVCIDELFGRGRRDRPRTRTGTTALDVNAVHWIDRTYIDATVEGLKEGPAADQIRQVFRAAEADFVSLRRRLAKACAAGDIQALVACLHSLNGCVRAVGWTRMGLRCIEVLHQLRTHQFTGWQELPGELDELFRRSTSELERLLVERTRTIPGLGAIRAW